MICDYCFNPCEWVENKEVYGRNIGKSIMIWLCRPCNAYVGCHQNTRSPLGTIANAELRAWRRKAHDAFDPLWRNGKLNREQAYGLLKKEFGCDVHIGECGIEQCKEIISFVQRREHERNKRM